MIKYTAKYFTKLFKAIPDENWKTGSSPVGAATGCALHHAFLVGNRAGDTLMLLFSKAGLLVSQVNDYGDGNGTVHFSQETPKARILAALEHIKSLSL